MKYFFIAQSALIEPVSAQQSILFVYCTTKEIHLLEEPDKGHSTVEGKQEKTDPWSSNSLLPS